MKSVAKQEKFDIKKLDYNKLLNIDEGRSNQLKLVEDNPYTEITNNQTYLLAKMRRTSLLKGRTGIQGIEKTMATQIRKFRSFFGETASGLVDITLPAEKKQQAEIDRWEIVRAEKKVEREAKEAERKLKHETAIKDFSKLWKDLIDSTTFENIKDLDDIAVKVLGVTGEFEEFNDKFLEVQAEIVSEYLVQKREKLQLVEDQRILDEEKAKLVKKQEAQALKDKKAEEKKVTADAEKRRLRLLPDKERLIEVFQVLEIPLDKIEKFENKEAQQVLKGFEKAFKALKDKYIKLAEKTL